MERNWFTFGPYDSRDFGIYITGSGTFDAPEKAYDTVLVPGRNGALILPENRLDNVDLTYPAYIYVNFDQQVAAMRSAFLGLDGYQILTDSYHPNEYRLAYFAGGTEVDPTRKLDAGRFNIEFNCKPQRYLFDGDQPRAIGDWTGIQTTTAEGSVVSFESDGSLGIKSLSVDITPVQSGSGDPSPTNVRPITGWTGANVYVSPTNNVADATTYPISFSTAGTVYGGTLDVTSGALTVDRSIFSVPTDVTWSIGTGGKAAYKKLSVIGMTNVKQADTTVERTSLAISNRLTPSTKSWSQSATSTEPLFVISSDDYLMINVGQSGMTSADFNTWLTNNPLEICYPLATPQAYTLTATQVSLLTGQNNLWADCGDVTVEYGADPSKLVNPTQQTARPLIRVFGYGTLTVGSDVITIASNNYDHIDIDSEIMDCFCGATNCNSLVSFSTHEFPVLPPGVTSVSYSGNITKVQVEPRWWSA